MGGMNKVLKRLARYARPFGKYFVLSAILSILTVAGTLAVPVLIGDAVNYAVSKGNVNFVKLRQIVIIMLAIIAFTFVFQWAAQRCLNRFSVGTVRELRKDIFAHIQKLPISYIDKTGRGNLVQTAVNDTDILSDGLLQGLTQLVSGVLTIVGTLAFMISISWRITVVVVLLTPMSFFVASKITKASHAAFEKQSALRGELNSVASEMTANQKLVNAFNYEERNIEKFEKYNQQMKIDGAKATFYSSLSNPATRFVNNIIYAATGLLGALAAMGGVPFLGVINVGQLTSFLIYSNQYTKPFNEISGVLSEFQNAVASAERVFRLLDVEEESDDSQLEEITDPDGSLRLENVYFSYLPTTRLISSLNINVQPHKRIAIVGPTGCGKTTVINLILRFYDVDEGTVFVSGQDIRTVKRNSLRKQFAMVLQDTWLFTGTVAENISYAKPDATHEEIVNAAKSAFADGFIRRLPNGYDTLITNGGENLSQGQRQLLCIARVMLTNPEYLILDEATSNIDLRTEQKVQLAFEKLMQNRTSIVIAHRLSTIVNADQIIVMNKGMIVEQGTHSELLELGGFYSNLYKSQFDSD